MNPARMTKPKLVTLCRLQEATIEAREALIIALRADILALTTERDELRAQAQPLQEQINTIRNRGQLMAKMRELSKQGVPCHMLGDYIRHSKTGAVIAQVAPIHPTHHGEHA